MSLVVHTVGHSTRPIEEFVSLLTENGIKTLVDVRRYPGSRRHPQFSSDTLRASLALVGCAYVHEADLGGRRSAREDSPHTAWRSEAFRGYADHMDTATFQQALARVLEAAARGAVAVMCAEAVPWRCHRQLIADALVARGVSVRHILGPRSLQEHALNPDARVLAEGRLVYAGADAQEKLF